MRELTSALEWRGHEMVDRDGQVIGKIDAIYLDSETDQPEWALVRHGRFGSHRAFVPISEVSIKSGAISASFPSETVSQAPSVDAGEELSERAEMVLRRHYGIDPDVRGESMGPTGPGRKPGRAAGSGRGGAPAAVGAVRSHKGDIGLRDNGDELRDHSSHDETRADGAPGAPAASRPSGSDRTEGGGTPKAAATDTGRRPGRSSGNGNGAAPAPERDRTTPRPPEAAKPTTDRNTPKPPEAAKPTADRTTPKPPEAAKATSRPAAAPAKPTASAPTVAPPESKKSTPSAPTAAPKAAKPTSRRAAAPAKSTPSAQTAAPKAAKPTSTAPALAAKPTSTAPTAAPPKAAKPTPSRSTATRAKPTAGAPTTSRPEASRAGSATVAAGAEVASERGFATLVTQGPRPAMEPLDEMARQRLETTRARYRLHADTYDFQTASIQPARDRAVERLELKEGAVVVDLGCGTGLAFDLIQKRIGRTGRIIGIDTSPEMLERAQDRIALHEWDNVDLLETSAEEAALPAPPDAVLVAFSHDILRSSRALETILRQARPGARVVATGAKWAPWWAPAVNSYLLLMSSGFVSSYEGFDRPWSQLATFVPVLRVEELSFSSAYVVSGELPSPSAAA